MVVNLVDDDRKDNRVRPRSLAVTLAWIVMTTRTGRCATPIEGRCRRSREARQLEHGTGAVGSWREDLRLAERVTKTVHEAPADEIRLLCGSVVNFHVLDGVVTERVVGDLGESDLGMSSGASEDDRDRSSQGEPGLLTGFVARVRRSWRGKEGERLDRRRGSSTLRIETRSPTRSTARLTCSQ